MKNSQKLVGVALLATAAVGLALPSISKAAPSVTGKGKVTFTQDLTTNPSNNKPGESTGPELNEPSQNTDPLALKIVSVTDMDFDSHNIISNDSNKSYEALPFATTTGKDDKKEPVKTAHFVRFQDVRADTTNNYFTISAKMTKQFSNATKGTTLSGATLDYKNISLVTGTNKSTLPSAATVKAVTPLVFDVEQTFVENKEVGKGFGVFELMFDTNENASAAAGKYKGVSLEVPGSTILRTGEYQAEITWSIADAK